jgi:hypothetical protein
MDEIPQFGQTTLNPQSGKSGFTPHHAKAPVSGGISVYAKSLLHRGQPKSQCAIVDPQYLHGTV